MNIFLQKIKRFFMPSHNEYFNKYVEYLPTIGKQLKLGRNGSVLILDKTTNQTTTYKNWEELNKIYKLFPVTIDKTTPTAAIKSSKDNITVSTIKYWTFGHPTRFNEIKKEFCKQYGLDDNTLVGSNFNKSNWVYYLDSTNSLVATNNTMVIDLLKNSSDWVEYILPEPKRFTKADIAGMIGMDVDSFVII